MGFWDDLSNMFKRGVSTVAKKTDEYTKIGKLKVDIIGVKREIDKQFTMLGGKVYQLIAEEKNTKIASNEEVKQIIDAIKDLNEKLNQKKEELEQVRLEYGAEAADAEVVVDESTEPTKEEDQPQG
ncbi:MAG: hypothetical protein GXO74_10340 [Calditrichaeota bacterium]|nr:hypothetical protein [Calditrichota bacterium]